MPRRRRGKAGLHPQFLRWRRKPARCAPEGACDRTAYGVAPRCRSPASGNVQTRIPSRRPREHQNREGCWYQRWRCGRVLPSRRWRRRCRLSHMRTGRPPEKNRIATPPSSRFSTLHPASQASRTPPSKRPRSCPQSGDGALRLATGRWRCDPKTVARHAPARGFCHQCQPRVPAVSPRRFCSEAFAWCASWNAFVKRAPCQKAS